MLIGSENISAAANQTCLPPWKSFHFGEFWRETALPVARGKSSAEDLPTLLPPPLSASVGWQPDNLQFCVM